MGAWEAGVLVRVVAGARGVLGLAVAALAEGEKLMLWLAAAGTVPPLLQVVVGTLQTACWAVEVDRSQAWPQAQGAVGKQRLGWQGEGKGGLAWNQGLPGGMWSAWLREEDLQWEWQMTAGAAAAATALEGVEGWRAAGVRPGAAVAAVAAAAALTG